MRRPFLFYAILVFGSILLSIITSSYVLRADAEEINMDLPEGWSLISLPLIPTSAILSDLFPNSETVYRYEKGSGYIRVEAGEPLEFGEGYWILLNEAQSYILHGESVQAYSHSVIEDGWSMIGGTTYPTQVSIEKGNINVIYRYMQGLGYQRVLKSEKMEPGKGHWILLENIEDEAKLEFYGFREHEFMQDPNQCQECHFGNPVFGQTDYRDLRFKDNIVTLCNRCHTRESLGESHPVNIVPPDSNKIPDDLHLDENMNMTCATCHQPHTKAAHLPFYLRRTNNQNELCLACHRLGADGPHGDQRIRSPKGVCATCHIPHKAKGSKIWARTSKKPGLYDGIHQLCQSCHDGTMFFEGNPLGEGDTYSVAGYERGDYPPIKEYKGQYIVKTREDGEKDIFASTGTDDVLDEKESPSSSEGPYENHVMHGGADITLDEALIFFDPEIFPLDPTDRDTYPQAPAPEKYRSGGAGFYCGTCHNPHKQPDGSFTGGFYLRTKPDNPNVGTPWNNRKPFCSQCHGVIHAPESDCLACHHPHLGKVLIKDRETLGRKIFRYPVEETAFEATPNVLKIYDPQDEEWSAAFCYGCHNGAEGNLWSQAVVPCQNIIIKQYQ